MLYDPRWNREPPEDSPGVPVRSSSLLWLMVALPWIVLFGMVGMAMNTVSDLGSTKVLTKAPVRYPGR